MSPEQHLHRRPWFSVDQPVRVAVSGAEAAPARLVAVSATDVKVELVQPLEWGQEVTIHWNLTYLKGKVSACRRLGETFGAEVHLERVEFAAPWVRDHGKVPREERDGQETGVGIGV